MIQTLWIWSRTHRWWRNGKYTITESALENSNYTIIQKIYYLDTGHILCKDALQYPRRPKLEVDWTPRPLAEILNILGGVDDSNLVGD